MICRISLRIQNNLECELGVLIGLFIKKQRPSIPCSYPFKHKNYKEGQNGDYNKIFITLGDGGVSGSRNFTQIELKIALFEILIKIQAKT
jgi:hypothetical protein